MMNATFATNGHASAHEADLAIDTLYSWWPGMQPAPQLCPEAVFSLTLKGTIDGHEALLTARGQTAAEFQANLEAIRGLLDAPASPQGHRNAGGPQGQAGTGWCQVHNVQMIENAKNGQRWYSHRLPEGGFCKGR